MCRGSDDVVGCYYTNRKIKYKSICGKLEGCQQGSHVGFTASFSPSKSINDPYLDGVSIPVGTPRNHAWSYAIGYSKYDGIKVNCPCAKHNGTSSPLFVKEYFYCGSRASDSPDLTTFMDQTHFGMVKVVLQVMTVVQLYNTMALPSFC